MTSSTPIITSRLSLLVVVLSLLLSNDVITAFSVGSRNTRSADDLANALSILQRQRRHLGVDDYYDTAGRLLGGRNIDIDTISDWLTGRPDPEEEEDREVIGDDWMANPENYEELDRDRYIYDFPPLRAPAAAALAHDPKPIKIQATKTELDDIFDEIPETKPDDDDLDEIFREDDDVKMMKKSSPVLASKKNKEEALNVGSGSNGNSKQVVKVSKKSVSNNNFGPSDDNSDSSAIALESLTKEELGALVKAVEKLQKQAQLKSDSGSSESSSTNIRVKEPIVRDTPEGRVVESDIKLLPAAESDELDDVFGETDASSVAGGVGAEVDIEEESGPRGTIRRIVEEELVPGGQPGVDEDDGEDEAELELENELLSDLEDELIEKENEAVAEEADVVQDIAERLEQQVEDAKEEEEAEEEQEAAAAAVELQQPEEDTNQILDPKLIEALQDKYWLVNKYIDDHKSPSKRSTHTTSYSKRSTINSRNFIPIDNDVDDDNDVIGDVTSSFRDDEEASSSAPDVLGQLESGSVPSVKEFVMKILALQAEVDQLRVMSRLEDLENDKLTDALNMATQAQAEGSVSDSEFSALQKAIQIEEAIQDLKNGDAAERETTYRKRGDTSRRQRPEVDTNDRPLFASRNNPIYPVGPAVRKKAAVRQEDVDKLAYLLQQAEVEEEEDVRREEEEEEEEEDSLRLPEVASIFLPNAGQCPAVRQYSTDCELADLYQLPVDREARALCNLHEMCYTCGHSLQVTVGQCDTLYRAAAASLCEGRGSCDMEAEAFLRPMKLKHRYVAHSQPHCRADCVAEFIGLL